MQATFVQDGGFIDHTPAADVAAGDVIQILEPGGDGYLGVATRDIPANTKGALALTGVFRIAKENAAINQGQKVYWDSAAKQIVATNPGTLIAAGRALYDTLAAETTVLVRLSWL